MHRELTIPFAWERKTESRFGCESSSRIIYRIRADKSTKRRDHGSLHFHPSSRMHDLEDPWARAAIFLRAAPVAAEGVILEADSVENQAPWKISVFRGSNGS